MVAQLENKIALITGGSSGIGRACVLVFVREGAKVVVADVNVEGGEETVKMVSELGGDSIFIKTDVSKANDVEAMVNAAVKTYGRLDCALNNAGIGAYQLPIAECSEEKWDRMININLKGVWLCMKYEIQQMLKQGKGAIVNTASTLGLVGLEKRGIYSAAKHGVVGLTKATALDYATAGIRVNAVCPGLIHTERLEHLFQVRPAAGTELLSLTPMGRVGTPEEVAEAMVWLCSDAASFVTGHAMTVDGGWVAR
ncbi:SDR family oxidoreductase [Chloroflexota bacterium]